MERALPGAFIRRLLTPTQEERIADWQTMQAAIAAGLGKAGFVYFPVPPQGLDLPIEDITSPDTRRRFGYGVRRAYEQSSMPTQDPNSAYVHALSSAQREAYQAALVDCSVQASQWMGLPPEAKGRIDLDLLRRRLRETSDRFWGSEEAADLVDRYCEDMRHKGFEVTRYSDPAELFAYDLDRLLCDASYREDLFERETKVSGLDAVCMEAVYQPLHQLWLAHAHAGLADVASSLDQKTES